MPMFSPYLLRVGRIFVEETTKAMIASVLKKPSELNKALDVIQQQSQAIRRACPFDARRTAS
jgi:chaperonin cofactor prefoldin